LPHVLGSCCASNTVSWCVLNCSTCFFFFQAEDGIRDWSVTGVQTCALPIYLGLSDRRRRHRDHGPAQSAGARFRGLPAPRSARRSEERRVGEEGRVRGGGDTYRK